MLDWITSRTLIPPRGLQNYANDVQHWNVVREARDNSDVHSQVKSKAPIQNKRGFKTQMSIQPMCILYHTVHPMDNPTTTTTTTTTTTAAVVEEEEDLKVLVIDNGTFTIQCRFSSKFLISL